MKQKMLLLGNSGRIYEADKKDIQYGVTSTVSCGGNIIKHWILIDYDDLTLKQIIEDVKKLQEEFELPSFYIMESSKGHYHAVCFKLLSFERYMKVLLSSDCCIDFRFCSKRIEAGTLRIGKKNGFVPRLVKIVENNREEQEDIKQAYFDMLRLVQCRR